ACVVADAGRLDGVALGNRSHAADDDPAAGRRQHRFGAYALAGRALALGAGVVAGRAVGHVAVACAFVADVVAERAAYARVARVPAGSRHTGVASVAEHAVVARRGVRGVRARSRTAAEVVRAEVRVVGARSRRAGERI